ncbi:MAG: prephenate dehydratase [Alphaproteobacteria bacterium]|nr:prephenate dehydratase [Alphaproteobacteria bacterium]
MTKKRAKEKTRGTIAFQGAPGAYSDLACRAAYPGLKTLPCASFEDAFAAVVKGRARLAMIPIENSVAGRVADIHHLLPNSGLHIVAEHFQRVNHHLLGVKRARLSDVVRVHSHVHALNQCRKLIRARRIKPVVYEDTAGAARHVADMNDPTQAAIASELAGRIYGLKSLKANIEDAAHNTTRFIVMAKKARTPPLNGPVVTSFIFRVKNVPSALLKALGGFATNGVNMTRLESYVSPDFVAAQFYADIEGHPKSPNVKRALEELDFYTHEVNILGVYPAHPYRLKMEKQAARKK